MIIKWYNNKRSDQKSKLKVLTDALSQPKKGAESAVFTQRIMRGGI